MGALTGPRLWVRATLPATGRRIAAVTARRDAEELIVVEPLTGMLRVTPNEAVAVALCLKVAASEFPHLDEDELVIEADLGDGWRTVVPGLPLLEGGA